MHVHRIKTIRFSVRPLNKFYFLLPNTFSHQGQQKESVALTEAGLLSEGDKEREVNYCSKCHINNILNPPW